jgi:hypothetical protein
LNSVLDLAGIATRGDLPQAIFDIARTNNGDLSISPPTYYYRVFDKRKTGARYDVIQYWFFYSFNDWAFSHFGVNDHEADWESVFVYFDDINTSDVPAGMVYSAHSDKLFRPWPSVSRMGDHPVIHVAPGSHASYPPTTIPNLMLAIPKRPATALRQLFYRIIESWKDGGEIIGGGEGHPWARRHDLLSTENAPWVTKYRGRWGARYLVDMPLRPRQQAKPGGSPGGPMWNGDGTIRLKWEDPVKWARV